MQKIKEKQESRKKFREAKGLEENDDENSLKIEKNNGTKIQKIE